MSFPHLELCCLKSLLASLISVHCWPTKMNVRISFAVNAGVHVYWNLAYWYIPSRSVVIQCKHKDHCSRICCRVTGLGPTPSCHFEVGGACQAPPTALHSLCTAQWWCHWSIPPSRRFAQAPPRGRSVLALGWELRRSTKMGSCDVFRKYCTKLASSTNHHVHCTEAKWWHHRDYKKVLMADRSSFDNEMLAYRSFFLPPLYVKWVFSPDLWFSPFPGTLDLGEIHASHDYISTYQEMFLSPSHDIQQLKSSSSSQYSPSWPPERLIICNVHCV